MLFFLTRIKNFKRKWYYINCAANNEVTKKKPCNGGILGNLDNCPCSKCPYYKYKKEENKDEK